LIGGGIILSDTIPGYLQNKDYLVRAKSELAAAKSPLDKLGANATEAEIDRAIRHSENAIFSLRSAEEGVERRRNESLLFGGGTLAVIALGSFLFMRGRRKSGGGAATATSLVRA
jgi:hypothetical protein